MEHKHSMPITQILDFSVLKSQDQLHMYTQHNLGKRYFERGC